jgi:hypothetical protein
MGHNVLDKIPRYLRRDLSRLHLNFIKHTIGLINHMSVLIHSPFAFVYSRIFWLIVDKKIVQSLRNLRWRFNSQVRVHLPFYGKGKAMKESLCICSYKCAYLRPLSIRSHLLAFG